MSEDLNVVVSDGHKAKSFTLIFQHIKHFCDHINLFFRTDHMYIQGMDHSHISIFELFLPAAWFDAYSQPCTETVIGLHVGLLHKILNTRDDGQEIFIKHLQDNPDKLFLHFITSNDVKRTLYDKHFELPLMELENEMMNIPDADYPAEFTLSATNYATIIGQLKQFGNDLNVTCNENEIRLSAKSGESGHMGVVLPIDDLNMFAINEGETIQVSYSLSHMSNICSFNKVADDITVCISRDYPLKATYLLEPMADDEDVKTKARLVIYLAPRIDEDE
jgi:proliferating cell nuclear antigen PCNA